MPGFLEGMKAWGGPAEFHEPTYSDIYDFLSRQAQENHTAGGGHKSLTKTEVAAILSSSQAVKGVVETMEVHVQKHRDFSHLEERSAKILELLKAKRGLVNNIFSVEDVVRLEEKALNFGAQRDSVWSEVLKTNEALPGGLREDHERPGLPVEGEC